MALVKVDNNIENRKLQPPWSRRDRKATRHKLPPLIAAPMIDYKKLKELCAIEGLQNRDNPVSSGEAHEEFMKNYSSMFVKPEPKSGFPIHSIARSALKGSQNSLVTSASKAVAVGSHGGEQAAVPQACPVDMITHDIRYYVQQLHSKRKSENPRVVQAEAIKSLRNLLKKLSFQRTAAENEQVFQILKTFPDLSSQFSAKVLKELCVVVQLDSWKDENVTVFGNSGWHLILKGSVMPQTFPFQRVLGERVNFRSPTPEPHFELQPLKTGECFGTLEKIEGRHPNSRVFTVQTLEPNCEFLKVSCSDYKRVIEQIRQREEIEKVNLLQSCETFSLWSHQPLVKLADVINWVKFPANTVLVSEGYVVPFIGIIKSGECHVLRQVTVLNNLPNGKKEKKTKQVVIGKLGPSESFGEISLIAKEPISCSIVSATQVYMACVIPEKLKELDEVIRQLLHQSGERTYGNLTEEDIHSEYIQQELKREWNEFKHGVVVDSINGCGVRPGYGKWAK